MVRNEDAGKPRNAGEGAAVNWLAHTFLSKPKVEFRLGNLLADVMKGTARDGMPEAFLEGVKCHRSIDAFTDYHPIVHRSRARLGDKFPRVTGILIDIFYDHFLALHWERYCEGTLHGFTERVYPELRNHSLPLPERAQEMIDFILIEDRFQSYRTLEGIRDALEGVSFRLSQRIGKDYKLADSIPEFETHFDDLAGDFAEFFPLLRNHVEMRL
jgi:acyl carrier protein phosphodiesterase